MPSRLEGATLHKPTPRTSYLTVASILILFAVNTYICQALFRARFIDQMGSTAGAFIAISRWIMAHWHDLSWYPQWFTGMPFFNIYQPGLHMVVAGVAQFFQLTPERAYFLVIALVYCLQPITLFWLCYRATNSRGCALAAGLAFSLISPSAFLAGTVRHELGGIWYARRYQTMIYYGESPHDVVLVLIPLVILFLYRTAGEGKRWYFPLACITIAAILLTNWPGTIGLMMAVLAYGLSRIGANSRPVWMTIGASLGIAYLLACRWVAPGSLLPIFRNAQQSDGTTFGRIHVVIVLAAGVAIFGLHLFFKRFAVDRWLRFFIIFAFISSVVALGRFWTGFNLLPQGHRWQLEMEMAIVGAIALFAWPRVLRLPPRVRIALLVLLSLGGAVQARTYRRFARHITQERPAQDTIEYRISKWLEANMPAARVFVPGSVSMWLNVFTDVPQMAGCCDPSVPSFSHRLAYYTLYSAENAGDRYIPTALVWLKAYGARVIAVTGPNSGEFFRPYAHPEAFRNALPLLWSDGDSAIYKVPTQSHSLAHVLDPVELVSRAPVNGLDTGALAAYVAALERPGSQARLEWTNLHQARIHAEVSQGQVISVQISYDPAWHAAIAGIAQRVYGDALGLLVIAPASSGACDIDLTFDQSASLRWATWAQILAVILALAWPLCGIRAISAKSSQSC